MALERYLLRADRDGYTYREILEVRPGAVRILRPSEKARKLARWSSTLFVLGFGFVFAYGIASLGRALAVSSPVLPGALVLVIDGGLLAFYFAGLIMSLLWWDDRNLPLLAENPDSAETIEILGVTSFGTFQEVRASTRGQEVRIAVHGSRARVEEALRFAASRTAPT